MKIKLINLITLFVLLNSSVFAVDSYEPGDRLNLISSDYSTINSEFLINPYQDFLNMTSMGVMLRTQPVLLIGMFPGNLQNEFIMSYGDDNVFGVYKKEDKQDRYLIDVDGDGILDEYFETPFIPLWAFEITVTGSISSENNIAVELDSFADIFNSNENPYRNDSYKKIVFGLLIDSMLNPEVENKDILYALFLFYYTSETYGLKNWILDQAYTSYIDRFPDNHHFMFTFHKAEMLWRLGDRESALSQIAWVATNYPDFIPGMIHSIEYYPESDLKEEIFEVYKEKYKDHWMMEPWI